MGNTSSIMLVSLSFPRYQMARNRFFQSNQCYYYVASMLQNVKESFISRPVSIYCIETRIQISLFLFFFLLKKERQENELVELSQKIGENFSIFSIIIREESVIRINHWEISKRIIKVAKKCKEFLFFYFSSPRREEERILEFIRIVGRREEELVKLESRGKFYSEEVSLFPLIFVFLLFSQPLISIRISSLWTFTGGASSIEGDGGEERGRAAAGTFNKAIANLVGPIKRRSREGKGKVTLHRNALALSIILPGIPLPLPSITQHKGICSNSWPNYWLW